MSIKKIGITLAVLAFLAAIVVLLLPKNDLQYKQNAVTTLSNNISNMYEDAIVTKLYDIEQQPREKVLESDIRNKVKQNYKDNFDNFSNCIIDKYKNASGKTFKELSNIDKESFKNDNTTLQLYSLGCSDKQLSVLVFLMTKFKYCPFGQMNSFVKQNIEKGIINKNRLSFSDFEPKEQQLILDEFVKKANCRKNGENIEICLPIGPDGVDSCNPLGNINKKCDEDTYSCTSPLECPDNLPYICPDGCKDLMSDNFNCGVCGTNCLSDQICKDGNCVNPDQVV